MSRVVGSYPPQAQGMMTRRWTPRPRAIERVSPVLLHHTCEGLGLHHEFTFDGECYLPVCWGQHGAGDSACSNNPLWQFIRWKAAQRLLRLMGNTTEPPISGPRLQHWTTAGPLRHGTVVSATIPVKIGCFSESKNTKNQEDSFPRAFRGCKLLARHVSRLTMSTTVVVFTVICCCFIIFFWGALPYSVCWVDIPSPVY